MPPTFSQETPLCPFPSPSSKPEALLSRSSRALDADPDSDPVSNSWVLDRLEEDPPTDESLDFFRRLFFGMAGRSCEVESVAWFGSLGFLDLVVSEVSLEEFLEGFLDCLGLSDLSFIEDSPVPFVDELRLDDFGSSGMSLDEEV